MEVSKEFLDNAAKRMFESQRAGVAWWKAMTKEERRAAYEAWLKANPGDFRAGWGFDLCSISRNFMEDVWEHHRKNEKP